MRAEVLSIVNLFGDCKDSTFKEDLKHLEYSYRIKLMSIPDKESLLPALPIIAERDNWRLRMLSESDEVLFDFQRGVDIGESYNPRELQPYKDDDVRLIYSIDKNKTNSIISIYDYEKVVDYLKGLAVVDFLGAISHHLDNRLVFEVIGEQKESFSTRSVSIINKSETISLTNNDKKNNGRYEQCGRYCQWASTLPCILPEDFYVTEKRSDGDLSKVFSQVCILLSICYVADYSSIQKDLLKIRMSGFKPLISEFNKAKIRDLAYDEGSVSQWFKIYDWCYTGGYTSDRLAIARNIISLNCPNSTTMQLNDSTIESIKSNFRIFEQDNVRQYIKVRNDVSKDLLDLQDRINSIVEGFTGDFRKNVVGLGSFFLTLVVVRVVASGQWTGAFSTQIVILSFVFIAFSIGLLIYSLLNLNKREKLYTKHYGQLRERYRLLLSEEEADKLFEDCDPNRHGNHLNYIQWQKNRYAWFWGLTLLAFSIFLILVWCYNMFETTNLFKFIKAIISCCIKSI